MSNMINRIIEIDSVAQQRLNDAYLLKEDVKKEVLEKTEQTKKLIAEKTNARIQQIREIESQNAKEKKEKIREENESIISKLNQTYTEVHETLEQEIFLRVINKNVSSHNLTY